MMYPEISLCGGPAEWSDVAAKGDKYGCLFSPFTSPTRGYMIGSVGRQSREVKKDCVSPSG